MAMALVGCEGSGGTDDGDESGGGQGGDDSGGVSPGSGSSSGTTGGGGACEAEPDTSTVDKFFSTLACTWTLYAEDRLESGTTDTRFVHGKPYEVVLHANKTLTLESEDGELVYEYGAAADSYSDEAHEANVFLKPSGESLIVQYDKAAGSLQVVLSDTARDYDWSFTSSEPPSVLEAEDVGFMAGTWSSLLTYTYSASGPTEAELCDELEVTIDDQGNATVTLGDADPVSIPYVKGRTFVGPNGSSGGNDLFRLEQCSAEPDGFTCDIARLGLFWTRPTGTTDTPTLSKLQLTVDESSFYTAEPSKVSTFCP